MNYSKLEILTEQVSANSLKESTTSGDVSQVGPLILPLIKKIFLKSLI